MAVTEPLALMGAPGSPYTRKMLALLRYRRIPHRMIWGSHAQPIAGLPEPKVKLLPTVYFPDGSKGELSAMVDSTLIIERLERDHAGRGVLPDDPALAFIDALIEDYADEWLTKPMFHYRWHYEEDANHAGPLLVFWQDPRLTDEAARRLSDAFSRRQIERLHVVGSNPVTAPVIEDSYARLVGILDRLIEARGFALSERPSRGDFALYGQLTQLGIVDPTPARLLEARSPRLRAWLDRVEDLSGLDPAPWPGIDEAGPALVPLLTEIGRTYAPVLLANARAIAAGQASFETEVDGRPWRQGVFPYQAKCLMTLRAAHAALPDEARCAVDALLAGTGCDALLTPESAA